LILIFLTFTTHLKNNKNVHLYMKNKTYKVQHVSQTIVFFQFLSSNSSVGNILMSFNSVRENAEFCVFYTIF
jgi:hypothetical protein